MDIEEYGRVENLTYLGYCDHLQEKYGIGRADYMSRSWAKGRGWSRTGEGLVVHHKYEDHAIMLSNPEYARNNPYEWQKAENLVYCDYLEHLFLHILICEYPSEDQNRGELVGYGGMVNFLVPELNDWYGGYVPSEPWKRNCLDRVITDESVYLTMLRRFISRQSEVISDFKMGDLLTSFCEKIGRSDIWDATKNAAIFEKIRALVT